jgi:hypothetical protein
MALSEFFFGELDELNVTLVAPAETPAASD